MTKSQKQLAEEEMKKEFAEGWHALGYLLAGLIILTLIIWGGNVLVNLLSSKP